MLSLVALSEWVFWDEFGSRFNFIAVDYLVYTHEVIGNIWESYPVGRLLAVLALPAVLAVWLSRRAISRGLTAPTTWRSRWMTAALLLAVPLLVFRFVSTEQKDRSDNTQANELAGNGIYEFFAANRNNELDYERFYTTLPQAEAFATVRSLLADSGASVAGETPLRLARHVVAGARPEKLNVVLVSVESLGSEFIGELGNTEQITPELDRLSRESLFFTNVYATGNRTVRGLEALSLSIPPTPGQSILKRPKNEEMFSLGAVLEDEGYDCKFVYGGYGYFDNMGYFFAHNDYAVVDRTALDKADIHYENIWGVADEDLFTLSLREADKSAADGKPFFLHVMTTSNHRPYTYPEGRIDIPSGSGRQGAVKYTDYAIGKFLREARTKPWFDNTVFVIVADHGASARGTTDIPVERYRIPLWIYSPKHVAAPAHRSPGLADRRAADRARLARRRLRQQVLRLRPAAASARTRARLRRDLPDAGLSARRLAGDAVAQARGQAAAGRSGCAGTIGAARRRNQARGDQPLPGCGAGVSPRHVRRRRAAPPPPQLDADGFARIADFGRNAFTSASLVSM